MTTTTNLLSPNSGPDKPGQQNQQQQQQQGQAGGRRKSTLSNHGFFIDYSNTRRRSSSAARDHQYILARNSQVLRNYVSPVRWAASSSSGAAGSVGGSGVGGGLALANQRQQRESICRASQPNSPSRGAANGGASSNTNTNANAYPNNTNSNPTANNNHNNSRQLRLASCSTGLGVPRPSATRVGGSISVAQHYGRYSQSALLLPALHVPSALAGSRKTSIFDPTGHSLAPHIIARRKSTMVCGGGGGATPSPVSLATSPPVSVSLLARGASRATRKGELGKHVPVIGCSPTSIQASLAALDETRKCEKLLKRVRRHEKRKEKERLKRKEARRKSRVLEANRDQGDDDEEEEEEEQEAEHQWRPTASLRRKSLRAIQSAADLLSGSHRKSRNDTMDGLSMSTMSFMSSDGSGGDNSSGNGSSDDDYYDDDDNDYDPSEDSQYGFSFEAHEQEHGGDINHYHPNDSYLVDYDYDNNDDENEDDDKHDDDQSSCCCSLDSRLSYGEGERQTLSDQQPSDQEQKKDATTKSAPINPLTYQKQQLQARSQLNKGEQESKQAKDGIGARGSESKRSFVRSAMRKIANTISGGAGGASSAAEPKVSAAQSSIVRICNQQQSGSSTNINNNNNNNNENNNNIASDGTPDGTFKRSPPEVDFALEDGGKNGGVAGQRQQGRRKSHKPWCKRHNKQQQYNQHQNQRIKTGGQSERTTKLQAGKKSRASSSAGLNYWYYYYCYLRESSFDSAAIDDLPIVSMGADAPTSDAERRARLYINYSLARIEILNTNSDPVAKLAEKLARVAAAEEAEALENEQRQQHYQLNHLFTGGSQQQFHGLRRQSGSCNQLNERFDFNSINQQANSSSANNNNNNKSPVSGLFTFSQSTDVSLTLSTSSMASSSTSRNSMSLSSMVTESEDDVSNGLDEDEYDYDNNNDIDNDVRNETSEVASLFVPHHDDHMTDSATPTNHGNQSSLGGQLRCGEHNNNLNLAPEGSGSATYKGDASTGNKSWSQASSPQHSASPVSSGGNGVSGRGCGTNSLSVIGNITSGGGGGVHRSRTREGERDGSKSGLPSGQSSVSSDTGNNCCCEGVSDNNTGNCDRMADDNGADVSLRNTDARPAPPLAHRPATRFTRYNRTAAASGSERKSSSTTTGSSSKIKGLASGQQHRATTEVSASTNRTAGINNNVPGAATLWPGSMATSSGARHSHSNLLALVSLQAPQLDGSKRSASFADAREAEIQQRRTGGKQQTKRRQRQQQADDNEEELDDFERFNRCYRKPSAVAAVADAATTTATRQQEHYSLPLSSSGCSAKTQSDLKRKSLVHPSLPVSGNTRATCRTTSSAGISGNSSGTSGRNLRLSIRLARGGGGACNKGGQKQSQSLKGGRSGAAETSGGAAANRNNSLSWDALASGDNTDTNTQANPVNEHQRARRAGCAVARTASTNSTSAPTSGVDFGNPAATQPSPLSCPPPQAARNCDPDNGPATEGCVECQQQQQQYNDQQQQQQSLNAFNRNDHRQLEQSHQGVSNHHRHQQQQQQSPQRPTCPNNNGHSARRAHCLCCRRADSQSSGTLANNESQLPTLRSQMADAQQVAPPSSTATTSSILAMANQVGACHSSGSLAYQLVDGSLVAVPAATTTLPPSSVAPFQPHHELGNDGNMERNNSEDNRRASGGCQMQAKTFAGSSLDTGSGDCEACRLQLATQTFPLVNTFEGDIANLRYFNEIQSVQQQQLQLQHQGSRDFLPPNSSGYRNDNQLHQQQHQTSSRDLRSQSPSLANSSLSSSCDENRDFGLNGSGSRLQLRSQHHHHHQVQKQDALSVSVSTSTGGYHQTSYNNHHTGVSVGYERRARSHNNLDNFNPGHTHPVVGQQPSGSHAHLSIDPQQSWLSADSASSRGVTPTNATGSLTPTFGQRLSPSSCGDFQQHNQTQQQHQLTVQPLNQERQAGEADSAAQLRARAHSTGMGNADWQALQMAANYARGQQLEHQQQQQQQQQKHEPQQRHPTKQELGSGESRDSQASIREADGDGERPYTRAISGSCNTSSVQLPGDSVAGSCLLDPLPVKMITPSTSQRPTATDEQRHQQHLTETQTTTPMPSKTNLPSKQTSRQAPRGLEGLDESEQNTLELLNKNSFTCTLIGARQTGKRTIVKCFVKILNEFKIAADGYKKEKMLSKLMDCSEKLQVLTSNFDARSAQINEHNQKNRRQSGVQRSRINSWLGGITMQKLMGQNKRRLNSTVGIPLRDQRRQADDTQQQQQAQRRHTAIDQIFLGRPSVSAESSGGLLAAPQDTMFRFNGHLSPGGLLNPCNRSDTNISYQQNSDGGGGGGRAEDIANNDESLEMTQLTVPTFVGRKVSDPGSNSPHQLNSHHDQSARRPTTCSTTNLTNHENATDCAKSRRGDSCKLDRELGRSTCLQRPLVSVGKRSRRKRPVISLKELNRRRCRIRFKTRRQISSSLLMDAELEPEVGVANETESEIWRLKRQQILRQNLPDSFFVVYAINDRNSFEFARQTMAKLRAIKRQDVEFPIPIVLVANKIDLERAKVVKSEEGRALAKKHACKFIEISCTVGFNLDNLLVGLRTQLILKHHVTLRSIMKQGKPKSKSKASDKPVTNTSSSTTTTTANRAKPTNSNNILVRFYKRYVMDNNEQNYDCDNFSKL